MNHAQWLAQVDEEALDPALPIVDAHHHVWDGAPMEPFQPFDREILLAHKSACGHNIVATVYVDSRSAYRADGPEALRVLGETAFADGIAELARARGGRAAGACAGIIAHADLTLGAAVGEVLDAHAALSRRFRGIRHMTAFMREGMTSFGGDAPEVMLQPRFRAGFAELARRDVVFDAWAVQEQLPEVLDLARAFPDATIVLDHLGGPLGIGAYAADAAATFAAWRRDMAGLARMPRVVVKLGGMNMHCTGLDAVGKPRPPTSEEAARLHRDHILAAIDLFGPARCMFESNFPVDMNGIAYPVVWNSFKRITAGYSAAERAELFAGTATRVYRLDTADFSA